MYRYSILLLVVLAAIIFLVGCGTNSEREKRREGYLNPYRKVDSLASFPDSQYRSAMLYQTSPGCAYGSDDGKVCTLNDGTAGNCYRGLCIKTKNYYTVPSYFSRFAFNADPNAFGAPCT